MLVHNEIEFFKNMIFGSMMLLSLWKWKRWKKNERCKRNYNHSINNGHLDKGFQTHINTSNWNELHQGMNTLQMRFVKIHRKMWKRKKSSPQSQKKQLDGSFFNMKLIQPQNWLSIKFYQSVFLHFFSSSPSSSFVFFIFSWIPSFEFILRFIVSGYWALFIKITRLITIFRLLLPS